MNRALAIAMAIALATVLLSACGQKGPLYRPDKAGAVVTRPASTATSDDSKTEPQPEPKRAPPVSR